MIKIGKLLQRHERIVGYDAFAMPFNTFGKVADIHELKGKDATK